LIGNPEFFWNGGLWVLQKFFFGSSCHIENTEVIRGSKIGEPNMEVWSEEEFRNKDLMAPCGLYCGAYGFYIATGDKNEKFKAVMGKLYGKKPEETECLGCMQADPPGMDRAISVFFITPCKRTSAWRAAFFKDLMFSPQSK
jgi:hypothetical protein